MLVSDAKNFTTSWGVKVEGLSDSESVFFEGVGRDPRPPCDRFHVGVRKRTFQKTGGTLRGRSVESQSRVRKFWVRRKVRTGGIWTFRHLCFQRHDFEADHRSEQGGFAYVTDMVGLPGNRWLQETRRNFRGRRRPKVKNGDQNVRPSQTWLHRDASSGPEANDIKFRWKILSEGGPRNFWAPHTSGAEIFRPVRRDASRCHDDVLRTTR